jgi:hypothetical protein
MTRITERSSAYPGGVLRPSTTTQATHFWPVLHDGAVNSLHVDYVDGDAGGIVPTGGSIELAYEPEPHRHHKIGCPCDCSACREYGGAGASDLDTGDDARDQGPNMEPEYE